MSTEAKKSMATQKRQQESACSQDAMITFSLMKGSGESRKEAQAWKSQLLTAKRRTKIGTWNVRILYLALES